MTHREPSELEILEGVRAGDRGSFELLYRRCYPGLLRFAHAQLGSRAEAEDVVHEVFLRVWGERKRLGGDRSPRTYLLAAVRNRVIDVLRHRGVERRWAEAAMDSDAPGRVGDVFQSRGERAFDPAALAELDAAIRHAIAELPERCRTAFLLCREQHLTYAEAAGVMGVSPATIKTQMARALAMLRVALDPFLAVLIALSLVPR